MNHDALCIATEAPGGFEGKEIYKNNIVMINFNYKKLVFFLL